MNFVRSIVYFVIFIITITGELYPAIRIVVPDTTVTMGNSGIITVPVRGTIDNAPLNQLRISFKYDSRTLDISKVNGGQNYVMMSDIPVVQKTYPRLDSAGLIVSDNNLQPNTEGIICTIEIEGLAGPDSISYLLPDKVEINGVTIANAELIGGRIKVINSIVYPAILESLGDNYPNPFDNFTWVPFSLKSTSKVRFMLYHPDGALIEDSWNTNLNVDFEYFDYNGAPIDFEPGESLERGFYYAKLTPVQWLFSSTAYYIIMLTDGGVYQKTMMYLK
jgi:hypothetical protein